MTGIQLGYHNKPIVFFDIGGFWAPMEVFLDHSVEAEVLKPEVRGLFRTASTAGAALDILSTW